MNEYPAIARLSEAERLLAEAKDLRDVKQIINIAEAARVWARTAKLGEKAAQHAEEIKLCAQRKAGEFLSKLQKGKGGDRKSERVKNQKDQAGPSDFRRALVEAEIAPTTAKRYQQVAAVSESRFAAYVEQKKADGGEITTAGLLRESKAAAHRTAKQVIVEKIQREASLYPEGPFRVIVIDPPWTYDSRTDDDTHRGRIPYPSMTSEQIKALSIPDFAHQDCILWLWTTNAFMREAFECLAVWGFAHKTILTWVKNRFGCGNWLRGQTEHCLLAVKGTPSVTLTNQSTALVAPVREHSRKPDEFYALVESLCPGNRLEMFAREARAGWQSWGVEVDLFGHTGLRTLPTCNLCDDEGVM